MANVSLKDATKVLVEEASGILEEATRIRKEADSLFDTLKRMDMEMNRQAEEEAANAAKEAAAAAEDAVETAAAAEDAANAERIPNGLAQTVFFRNFKIDDRAGVVQAHLNGVHHKGSAPQGLFAVLHARIAFRSHVGDRPHQ